MNLALLLDFPPSLAAEGGINNNNNNNEYPQPRPLVIDICGRNVTTSASIRDLGVHLDSTLSITAHISRTCRTAYAQLRCIAHIRSALTLRACKTLVHALVTSRLDFGNAAQYGITGTLLYRLEMVQRSAAHVILRLHRRDQHSMTEALRELHWLPVTQHIDFKLLTFMHSAVHANIPRYLADRITPYVPHRSLHSADQALVCVPRVNLKRFGQRAFSCAGPTLWNSLPFYLRKQQDSGHFKKDLKTFFFKQAFS